MVTYRPVPARILSIDYVGISTAASETYLKRAEAELSKLEGMVVRGGLDQGTRRFNLGDNAEVECTVCFNLKQAVVTIGRDVKSRTLLSPCYCCSPCLVAGLILATAGVIPEGEDGEGDPRYEYEEDYYADILVCQAPNYSQPMSVTVYEERASAGVSNMSKRVLQSRSYGGEITLNSIYSDYQNHQVGDSVMVLVQPLYEFVPAPFGIYSPCVNRRQVADESFLYPALTCSEDFIESSGSSCNIMADKNLWTYDGDAEIYGEIRKNPFRILPIKIKSCL